MTADGNRESAAGEEIREAIRPVLLQDWDPIGVRGGPGTRDEYDAYIGGVYRLLSSGETERQIVPHLAAIERERMAMPRDDESQLITAARKLLAIPMPFRVKRAS